MFETLTCNPSSMDNSYLFSFSSYFIEAFMIHKKNIPLLVIITEHDVRDYLVRLNSHNVLAAGDSVTIEEAYEYNIT